MSKIINFFATRKDLLDLLANVESVRAIHYAEAGMSDEPKLVVYGSASTIPGLGELRVTEANLGPGFLLADMEVPFAVRHVPQRRGGNRFAMDQRMNPDSVDLVPGGQFDAQTILAGRIGTCTDSPVSAALLAAIAASIRKKWTQVKSYAVGPEALGILDAGGRLTANLRSPREYDLQR